MNDRDEGVRGPLSPPTGSCVGWEQDPRFRGLIGAPGPCQCEHCRIARSHGTGA